MISMVSWLFYIGILGVVIYVGINIWRAWVADEWGNDDDL